MILLSLMLATGLPACSPEDALPIPELPEQPGGNDDADGETPDGSSEGNRGLRIQVGSSVFTATLVDNATAKAFNALLPLTVNMSEHNRNEKYYDLPLNLPAAVSNLETIHSGDIVLYGTRTLVLFYKTFPASYSYTRIGAVDNPSGLERVLGPGRVTVIFQQVQE